MFKYLIDALTKTKDFITGYANGTVFGLRDIPELNMYNNFHIGNDYNCPTGTALYAIEDGEFLRTVRDGYGDGYGNYILFYVPKYNQTFHLSHLSNIQPLEGSQIKKGTVIGHTGNTGESTGPHLHLGVALGKKYDTIKTGWIDPSLFDFSKYEGSKPQSENDRTGKTLVVYPQWLLGDKDVTLVHKDGTSYPSVVGSSDGRERRYKIVEQVNDGFYRIEQCEASSPLSSNSPIYVQWRTGIGFE